MLIRLRDIHFLHLFHFLFLRGSGEKNMKKNKIKKMTPSMTFWLRLSCTAMMWLSSAGAVEPVAVTATLDVSHPGPPVPKSFAGLSREWRRFPSPDGGPAGAVHPVYLRLLEHLVAFNDEGLSFRIGGNSADGMGTVPEDDRWRQIGEVFKATRTPVIINLNLAREDAELDKAWIRAAQRLLPPGAIATFELGNEPDGWKGRYRPEDYTYEQYLEVFHKVAEQLVPAFTPGLAGPAWAHSAPPDVLTQFLAKERPLINLLTVHSYRFDPKGHPEVKKLLDEGPTAGFAKSLAPGIQVAHDAGLKLRLGETGSAWGGGIAGFSDTYACSIWTIDFLFELARAGLDGVNFHGGGISHYTAIKEDVDKASRQAIISASAPYYGLLVFSEAVAHEARFVPVQGDGPAARVKIWATLDRAGTVRVVVINKDLTAPADVDIRLPGKYAGATLKRLEAPSLDATTGLTYAGQTFDGSADGNPMGTLQPEPIAVIDSALRFRVAPATAALMTVTPPP
jgi:hypothetical protein